jgi:hypothetical protein
MKANGEVERKQAVLTHFQKPKTIGIREWFCLTSVLIISVLRKLLPCVKPHFGVIDVLCGGRASWVDSKEIFILHIPNHSTPKQKWIERFYPCRSDSSKKRVKQYLGSI